MGTGRVRERDGSRMCHFITVDTCDGWDMEWQWLLAWPVKKKKKKESDRCSFFSTEKKSGSSPLQVGLWGHESSTVKKIIILQSSGCQVKWNKSSWVRVWFWGWSVPRRGYGYVKMCKWFTEFSAELAVGSETQWEICGEARDLAACSCVISPREWPQTSCRAFILCLCIGQKWKHSL